MPRQYIVSYRHGVDEDIYSIEERVVADSLHQAVGIAWPFLQKDVESFGGTIDDLDGWEVEEKSPRQDQLAYLLFVHMTGGLKDDWNRLPTEERTPYYDGVQAVIDGKIK